MVGVVGLGIWFGVLVSFILHFFLVGMGGKGMGDADCVCDRTWRSFVRLGWSRGE